MKRAQILERLIKSKGYSFRSIAEKCNIPYTSVYTILKRTGVNKASVKVIVKICKELGIKVEDLEEIVTGENAEKSEPTYDDMQQLIAQNGNKLTTDEKKLLNKIVISIINRKATILL
ncbi:helix-turn-helix transcriptional regulator [uncultured Robinsoniella sp.]|uniref:helix-turn-helix domain-containing protein n=1 Tax=uncultured Robinsoniella sp. TaxID=904190 RepID=UPI0020578F55|nr:MAG TPA: Cro/C1-type HTH DNA-binding domain protein [Caudoviricetes sp.]